MQAALPDINSRILRHTHEIYRAIREENYTQAAISIEACNGDLPKEYKLEINSAKYYELVKGIKTTECSRCGKEIPEDQVKPYQKLLSNDDMLLLSKRFLTVWRCPNCLVTNPYYLSKKYLTMKDKHDYFGVIPEPPSKAGMHDRVGRTYKWKEWLDICFKELENKIMLYRTEYAALNRGNDVIEEMDSEE